VSQCLVAAMWPPVVDSFRLDDECLRCVLGVKVDASTRPAKTPHRGRRRPQNPNTPPHKHTRFRPGVRARKLQTTGFPWTMVKKQDAPFVVPVLLEYSLHRVFHIFFFFFFLVSFFLFFFFFFFFFYFFYIFFFFFFFSCFFFFSPVPALMPESGSPRPTGA